MAGVIDRILGSGASQGGPVASRNPFVLPAHQLKLVFKLFDELGSLAGHLGRILIHPLNREILRIGSGATGFAMGVIEIDSGVKKRVESLDLGDLEGVQEGNRKLFSGTLGVNASLCYLSGKVAFAAGQALLGAIFLGVAEAAFGFAAGASLVVSLQGAARSISFRRELDLHVGEDPASLKETLAYLMGQVENEVGERAFKRRTSGAALRLLKAEGPRLIEQLSAPTVDSATLDKAKGLISKVRRENLKKTVLFSLAALASAIALVALFIGTFFSMGSLPILLYIIASVLYLGIGVYTLVSKRAENQGIKSS